MSKKIIGKEMILENGFNSCIALYDFANIEKYKEGLLSSFSEFYQFNLLEQDWQDLFDNYNKNKFLIRRKNAKNTIFAIGMFIGFVLLCLVIVVSLGMFLLLVIKYLQNDWPFDSQRVRRIAGAGFIVLALGIVVIYSINKLCYFGFIKKGGEK